MIIILIGYMGSGKTSVGQLLADHLQLKFNDLDQIIESSAGMPIPDIFNKKGEIYFRKLEHQCLKHVLDQEQDLVLSLGGGTPCYANNMALIAENAKARSIYLNTSIPVLTKRLQTEQDQRPLISHLKSQDDLVEFIGKHLFERRPFYMQADHSITTDGKAPEKIASEIAAIID